MTIGDGTCGSKGEEEMSKTAALVFSYLSKANRRATAGRKWKKKSLKHKNSNFVQTHTTGGNYCGEVEEEATNLEIGKRR